MHLPKIIRYVISGGTAAFTSVGLLFVFVHFIGAQYIVASAFAFIFGFLVSFTLQKLWTFNNKGTSRTHIQLAQYLAITLGNLALNTLLVYTGVEILGLWYLLAQLIASGLIAFYSYFVYRRFVFNCGSFL
ncbi:MAG: GtrA family protein [Candidatus Kaiserbacteria bacterium]|nr:GtrA family protein [Candidatus Kaiserbacteria bacterium]